MRSAAPRVSDKTRWEIPAMALIHIIVLALLQGITEFLPISSSAHLILAPALGDWPDQGPLVDVAVHVGTLGAVIVYFRSDVLVMLRGAVSFLNRRRAGRDEQWGERLAGLIILATVPVVVAGLVVAAMGWLDHLRNIAVIGWATLLFGVLLYVVDRRSVTTWRMDDIKWRAALVIGLAQMLALIPGTSRSGITMTAARALGFSRPDSAHFSMLLSIPTIVAAGLLAGFEIIRAGDVSLGLDALVAAALSFVTALLAIAFLMRWLERATFTPFVIYRVVLGFALLWWAYA